MSVPAAARALRPAYLATAYWAYTPRGAIEIRVGVRSLVLERVLREYAERDWIFLTAFNPHSRPAPAAVNQAAQTRLLARLHAAGGIVFPGTGVPDGTGWVPEPGFLGVGIDAPRGLALAAEFGQNALLAGAAGTAADLLWTAESEAD